MPLELPPELWTRIIRFALPTEPLRALPAHLSKESSTWRQHADTLRAVCLVCLTWRAIAQPLLFEHVFVNDKTLPLFLEAVASSPTLASSVRVLKVRRSTRAEVDGQQIGAVLRALPHLRELFLTQTGSLDLAAVQAASNLRLFHAWGVKLSLSSSTPSFSLPNLRHISICGTEVHSSAIPFFSRSTLTSLAAAAICYCRNAPGEDQVIPRSTVGHILDNQPADLFLLTTWNPRQGLDGAETAPHTVYTFREQTLEWEDHPPVAMAFATSTVWHFQLQEVETHGPATHGDLLDADPTISDLKTLYLAGQPDEPALLEHSLGSYAAFCKKRGIELVALEDPEFMTESLLSPELLRRHGRAEL
ncbi:hypothetical protein JCM10207_006186 [Rhodosporidiobolus poonsookiae]